MRQANYLILVAFAAFFALISLTNTPQEQTKVVEEEESGPGHPGWMEQWKQMKTLGSGEIDFDRVSRIRAAQRMERHRRSAGNLINVTELGPYNVGGRTRAMVIDQTNPDHLLAGGVSGGMWASFDRGASWEPLDDFGANLSVSYITQNPLNPSIFYYATGEPAGNSAGIPGNGIYKSTDTGRSFEPLPATTNDTFDYTWRIVHSLVDTHTIYVGTDRDGLYRSTDGGSSFSMIYNTGNSTITDIEVFADSSIMIGVEDEGIYFSPTGDSGTFERRQKKLPSFGFRRVEMAYCDSFPDVVYATLVNSASNGILDVYRSEDRGQTWDTMANPMDQDISFSFPWYCLTMAVKPNDPDYLVMGSVGLGFSMNGGDNWVETEYSHADNHVIRFDPENPNEFYVGNDGGLYRYNTGNAHFEVADLNNGFNVTQFYAGAFFPNGDDVYGGTQDNGTQSTKNGEKDFDHIYGGDGAFTQINQQIPSIAYVSWQRGHIYYTNEAEMREPYFQNIMNELDSDDDNDIDDGAWFINPFETNRKEGFQLYFPTRKRLWRSITGGANWDPITEIVNAFGTPYAVGVTNEVNPTVYLGGSEAMFMRIEDANLVSQPNEENLSYSVPDSITNHFIGNITVSPQHDTVLYVALTNYSDEPRIYKVVETESDTPRWTALHNNLPQGLPVNWVEVSPLTDSVLMAATDFGLYTSADAGQSWTREKAIPNVSIHQIRLRHSDGKLFVYTHGRGIFTAQIPGDFNQEPSGTQKPVVQDLEIYPNPAANQFRVSGNIKADQVMLFIHDMSGRVVRQEPYQPGQPVNINDLEGGMYVVRLTAGDKAYSGRLVKQ